MKLRFHLGIVLPLLAFALIAQPVTIVLARESAPSSNASTDRNVDKDGDGITNQEEAEDGSNPNSAHSDWDNIPDGEDGWPTETELAPPRVPRTGYTVIPLTGPNQEFVGHEVVLLNDRSQAVVLRRDNGGDHQYLFWDGGVVTPITDFVTHGVVDLNNNGVVILNSHISGDVYTWSVGAGFVALPFLNPNANNSFEVGSISDEGVIFGFGAETAGAVSHRFGVKWTDGVPARVGGRVRQGTHEVMTEGGPTSAGWITHGGVVLMRYDTYEQGNFVEQLGHTYYDWVFNGFTRDIQTPDGTYPVDFPYERHIVPSSINDNGQILGYTTSQSPDRTIIWLPNNGDPIIKSITTVPEGTWVHKDLNNRLQFTHGSALWSNYQLRDVARLAGYPTKWSELWVNRVNNLGVMSGGGKYKLSNGGTIETAALFLPMEVNSMDRFVAGSIDEALLNQLGSSTNVGFIFRNKQTGERYEFTDLTQTYIYNSPYSKQGTQDEFLSESEVDLHWSNDPVERRRLTQNVVFYRENGQLHFRALFNSYGEVEVAVVAGGQEMWQLKTTLSYDYHVANLLETVDKILSGRYSSGSAPVAMYAPLIVGGSPMMMLMSASSFSNFSFFARPLTIKVLIPAWDNAKAAFVKGVRLAAPGAQRLVQTVTLMGKGFVEGVWAGLEDDASSVTELAAALQNPAETAKSFYEGCKALLGMSFADLKKIPPALLKEFLDKAEKNIPWQEPDSADLATYIVGYTTGFFAEQITMSLVTGVFTSAIKATKIGSKVAAALSAVKKGIPIFQTAEKAYAAVQAVRNSAVRRLSALAKNENAMKRLIKRIDDTMSGELCPLPTDS